jgi:hypothetical protein
MFYKAIVGGVPIVADQDPEKLEIPQQLKMLGLDTLRFRFSAYLQSETIAQLFLRRVAVGPVFTLEWLVLAGAATHAYVAEWRELGRERPLWRLPAAPGSEAAISRQAAKPAQIFRAHLLDRQNLSSFAQPCLVTFNKDRWSLYGAYSDS